MGVIPNKKNAFIFPISCILVLIFPFYVIYFPKCEGKGSFSESQIKSLGLGNEEHSYPEHFSTFTFLKLAMHLLKVWSKQHPV